jgi:hypothetical protein
MSKLESGKASFPVGAADVAAHRLVQLDSGAVVHNTGAAADDPIGVTEYPMEAGGLVMVRLLADPGFFELEASGAITDGADVFAAADGKVSALPAGAGDYRRIGKALEPAGSGGDVIKVLPYNYCSIATVA